MANVVADPAPAACGARAVHQRAEQIDRAVEQVLMLGRQVRAIEIRNAGHEHGSQLWFGFSMVRTEVSGKTPPRWRASVSRPESSQSPAAARLANFSQVSVQSPRW